MNSARPSTPPIDTRSQILDAADARFRQYGYGKTTMAEIAEDVQMSAANLYRYFENKFDLGTACCSRAMQQRVERLRVVARRPNTTATKRLSLFFVENLRFTHEFVGSEPRLNELVETMTSKCPDLVHEKIAAIESLISEILAFGNETGEFQVDDVTQTARVVHASMVLFEVPLFVGLYSLEHFEHVAVSLAELLVQGLRR